jgi:hypothetical protein
MPGMPRSARLFLASVPEHVREPRGLLDEMLRVTRPGSLMILRRAE